MAKGKIVVALVILSTILALILFVPYNKGGNNPDKFKDSEYYDLICGIDDYLVENSKKPPKNNFESMIKMFKRIFGKEEDTNKHSMSYYFGQESAVGYKDISVINENAYYQTGDEIITTADYIYSLEKMNSSSEVLRIYSADGENSVLINEYAMPNVMESSKIHPEGMFLSEDGKTLTLVGKWYERQYGYTAAVSLNVSDPRSITEKGSYTVYGDAAGAYMYDDKIVIATKCGFSANDIDYSRPSTFVPLLDFGNGYKYMKMEDISIPNGISSCYCVFSVFDASSCENLDNQAIMGYASAYFDGSNIFAEIWSIVEESSADTFHLSRTTDIAILSFAGGIIEYKDAFSVPGYMADNRNCIDEKEGYLRLVVSTIDGYWVKEGGEEIFRENYNISLYVYDLENKSFAYKAEDFAVNGEILRKVRFKGDNLYICTEAETNADTPVYSFDLSDYGNVIFKDKVDTVGSHLATADMGEDMFLGLTKDKENVSFILYKEEDGNMIEVDKFNVAGGFYYISMLDAENNVCGFLAYMKYSGNTSDTKLYYILIQIDGEQLVQLDKIELDREKYKNVDVSSAYCDGCLYIFSSAGNIIREITE